MDVWGMVENTLVGSYCLLALYGTLVKIPSPQLRLRVINRALYFTYGKGTWGGGAYYLWGVGCMRGNRGHDVTLIVL